MCFIFAFIYFKQFHKRNAWENGRFGTACIPRKFSGYIYARQASVDMDISMDIHGKSVDMDMDGKFHIHGKPAYIS